MVSPVHEESLKNPALLLWKRLPLAAWLTLAGLAVVTVLALLLLGRAMRGGVWAYSDSAEYIVSARMLLAGRGLGIPTPSGNFSPLALHPPLYSLMLVPFLWAGIDPLDGLPWLNLVLFAATLLGCGWLVYRLSGLPLLALSATALLGFSPTLLRNFDSAMSEAPYLCFSLLGTLLLAWYWERPSSGRLAAAGVAAGLAGLTRYVGLALLPAGWLVILFSGQPWKQRTRQALLFTILAAGPLLVWFIGLFAETGQVAARSLAASDSLGDKFFLFRKKFVETLVSWTPYTYNLASWGQKTLLVYGSLGGGAALGGLAAWRVLRRKTGGITPLGSGGLKLLGVVLVSGVFYGLLVAASYLFSSITPDINDRTLSPLLPLIELFLCTAGFIFIRAFRLHPAFQLVPVLAVLVACQFYYPQSASLADNQETTLGYAAPQYRSSELIAAVRSLPPDQALVSNLPVVVLLYSGRFPYSIRELDTKTPPAVPGLYGSDSSDPAQVAFRQKGAALVIFKDELPGQLAAIYGSGAGERMASFLSGLTLVRQTQDGAIYLYPVP